MNQQRICLTLHIHQWHELSDFFDESHGSFWILKEFFLISGVVYNVKHDAILSWICVPSIFSHDFLKSWQPGKQKIKPCFGVFANFHSVNSPTMANFKLPMWWQWTWTWEEMVLPQTYKININNFMTTDNCTV